MGRSLCCSKEGMNKGTWTALEDKILSDYINIHGEGKWKNLPERAGLKRCGKSCRLRWLNYLRPDIKRGNISHDEEDLIIRLHKLLGNRWSLIAGRLPGRTDNEIKNYWNTILRKKVQGHPTSTSTHNKQLSNQSKQKKKKKSFICIPSMESSPPPPSPKMETVQVIRTKALRCNKVFLATPELNQVEHLENDIKTVEFESNEGLFSIDPSEDKDTSWNYMMDFNLGELYLSDLSIDLRQPSDLDDIALQGHCNKHCVLPEIASDDLRSLDCFLDHSQEVWLRE